MLGFLTKTHARHVEGIEDYDVAFLGHLKAEYETTFSEPKAPDAVRKVYDSVIQRYSGDEQTLTKADLYTLDRVVLAVASSGELRAEAPGLYQRYCAERGEAVDPSDPAMKCPPSGKPEDPVEIECLRARLQQILRALHWSYTFGPLREKRRVRLIEEAMLVMVFATAVLAGILILLRNIDNGQGHPFFAVLATAVYAGIMGGMVSCTRRLSEVPTSGDALGSIYALKNSRYVLYFAPLTGAVFAVVTMLLFMGQVLKGMVFPSFPDLAATGAVSGQWQFTRYLLPASSKDYALLFLWCFIAGFAERFIPDTLTDLTQRASDREKSVSGVASRRGIPVTETSNASGIVNLAARNGGSAPAHAEASKKDVTDDSKAKSSAELQPAPR